MTIQQQAERIVKQVNHALQDWHTHTFATDREKRAVKIVATALTQSAQVEREER